MQTVNSIRVTLTKDTFNAYSYRIPKYELPAIMNLWGRENVAVSEKDQDPLEFENTDAEIHRIFQKYGEELTKRTYGDDFYGALEKAIEESTIEKRDLNGSENAIESENGISAEVRV